jgi:UDP-N-acetylmuramoyl-L-alanyl-D-glutamate--2,6-diaminopimelate ligase
MKDRIMRLSNLIASSEGLKLSGPDSDITGLTTDSRKVEPGFLFIAIPGTKEDGRSYIEQALQRGAVAVLAPEGTPPVTTVATVFTPNIRRSVSTLAATFYPRQPEVIAAITGTSGKTSTAQFVREMWQTLGHKSASIGTLGLVTADENRYGTLTTPDAIALHQLLHECASKGVTHLALEASSHGLALNRLDHVKVQIGAFTNFSRDHLDYHTTMDEYLKAKLRLFTDVMADGGTAVLNADIPEFDTLYKAAKSRKLKIITYGSRERGLDIRLNSFKAEAQGQKLNIEVCGKNYDVLLPVLGNFQIWNAFCALGIVIASGGAADKAVDSLTKVSGVPGRLQLAGISKSGGTVFVDYAHKPDALENVLTAVRPHVAAQLGAKLGIVFGCGGDRDQGKRPIMGEIAQRLADWVIVTDDNPRHEEPARIRQEILAGCKSGSKPQVIGDRAEAITTGIGKLQKGDVLIIAGKGHESGQIIGDKTLPFDDIDAARKALGL